ncbi:MAG: putative metal-dependent hydrolase [Rickettsiales bacterium]|jgi:predicted metal-dependent hydrolase
MKEIFIKNRSYKVIARKSSRSKRIKISIDKNLTISLIIPKYQTYKLAKDFLLSKINWVDKSLDKIRSRNLNLKEKKQKITLSDEELREYSKVLINRLNFLAEKYNFTNVGKVTIKNQKTLWGSCSSKNNINLNVNLIKLKQELIDYVILHELTHIRIKNHSKIFWRELEKFVPNVKSVDRKLKGCGFTIERLKKPS